MLDEQEAKRIYSTVILEGSQPYREPFIDSIKAYDFGLTGEIARNLNDSLDEKFLIGLEFGIMIGLNLVYNFRKVDNE